MAQALFQAFFHGDLHRVRRYQTLMWNNLPAGFAGCGTGRNAMFGMGSHSGKSSSPSVRSRTGIRAARHPN